MSRSSKLKNFAGRPSSSQNFIGAAVSNSFVLSEVYIGHAPGDAALAPSAQIFNMLMLELLRATVHRGWTKTRELGDETKTERVD